MREYEVVYIFRADLEAEEVDERLERYHDRLGEGEVTAVEHWGQRQLAYEIKDERKGYYVVVQFRTEPSSLTDFEQGLRHDEDLLRHLVVLSEGELPIPPSQRGEDEEEDEEEPEEDEEAAGDEPEEGDEDGDEEEGDADEDEREAAEDEAEEDGQDEPEEEEDEEDAEDEPEEEDEGDAGNEDEEASGDDADQEEEK